MQKIAIITLLLSMLSLAIPVDARITSVKGYYKPSSGVYVMPSYRTSPNSYKFDNYSSRGNYNPYSGKKGYKSWY